MTWIFSKYLLYYCQFGSYKSNFLDFYFHPCFMFKIFTPTSFNQTERSPFSLVLPNPSFSAFLSLEPFTCQGIVCKPVSLSWLTWLWPVNMLSHPWSKFHCQTSTPNVLFSFNFYPPMPTPPPDIIYLLSTFATVFVLKIICLSIIRK